MRGGRRSVTAAGISPNHFNIQRYKGGLKSMASVCSRKTPVHKSTICFTPGVIKLRQSKLYRRAPNRVAMYLVYGLEKQSSKMH